MEKEKKGYKWVATGDSGYWSKENDKKAKHSHKVPMFCPYEECRKITGTVDDEYMLKYGICRTCYVLYVEEREKPLIDVQIYRKRLDERGF